MRRATYTGDAFVIPQMELVSLQGFNPLCIHFLQIIKLFEMILGIQSFTWSCLRYVSESGGGGL